MWSLQTGFTVFAFEFVLHLSSRVPNWFDGIFATMCQAIAWTDDFMTSGPLQT